MIDITTTRVVASQNHPPAAVFILLGALCLVGALLIGQAHSTHRVRWFYPVVFAAILSTTVYVIVDLQFPRVGFIRVDGADRVLADLRASMQ